MKILKLNICVLITFLIFIDDVNSQSCTDCFCGTVGNSSLGEDTLFGGRYKPSRSDIGGAPSGLDFFPVLLVFVQFADEPYSNSSSPDAWNSGQPPNYMNNLIDSVRRQSSNWWDSYNGYAVSDYWHEFSHGKLHVIGRAESIILPESTGWYEANGGGPRVNKDVYDILKTRLNEEWINYDNWKFNREGVFTWEKDSIVDMVYLAFRQHRNFLMSGSYLGIATLGETLNDTNNLYTVYKDGSDWVRIFARDIWGYEEEGIGSGLRVFADSTSPYSRQTFLDVVTHEHGHYLFQFGHRIYGKMAYGNFSGVGYFHGWEFSLSPWESIKLNYIKPEIVNYATSNYSLGDYSNRYTTYGNIGGALQVPISDDGEEFFLIANRRKVSEWDRRIGGDTLAEKRWQFLKNINPDYGKGIYIYHNKNGYRFPVGEFNDIDLECADGLWNWTSAGITRKRIDNNQFETVYKKTFPKYDNDDPLSSLSGKDEMSRGIIFSPGSSDIFSGSITRGIHSIYTNESDYWFSLATIGDRWDAWNVGYNEIFSPYSSPSTNKWDNTSSRIFIWYYEVDANDSPAYTSYLKIYRSGIRSGELPEDTILQLTPPSRPMGLVVDYHVETENIMRPILTWNHNMEPDMLDTSNNKKKYKIWRATSTGMSVVPTNYTLHKTVEIDSGTAPSYIDTTIYAVGSGWPGIGNTAEYPVRYKIQAVDKYQDTSVRSDFDMGIGLIPNVGCPLCTEGPDNFISDTEIPKEFKLYSNYPNPFNPVTNIKFELPKDVQVSIKIYDMVGREVKILVNEFKTAGRYSVTFSGADFASGVYYYKIKAGEFEQVRKMILLK